MGLGFSRRGAERPDSAVESFGISESGQENRFSHGVIPQSGGTHLTFPHDRGDSMAAGDDDNVNASGSVYVFGDLVTSCPADTNCDAAVGIIDLLALLAVWGPNPGHLADFNGDNTVNIIDLLNLLAAWGACP